MSEEIPTKTFNYRFEVQAVPYNEKTFKAIFGDDASFVPEYAEQTMADEVVGDLFRDAILSVAHSKMLLLSRSKVEKIEDLTEDDKRLWEYLERKEDSYEAIRASLKPAACL